MARRWEIRLGSFIQALPHPVYKFGFCFLSNGKSKGERKVQKQVILLGVSDRLAADGEKSMQYFITHKGGSTSLRRR